MKKDEKASVSAIKIIAISIIVLLCSGIAVKATNVDINNVKIQFANNYELNILTTKTNVEEILRDNHIVIASDEIVRPALEESITSDKTIKIMKSSQTEDTKVNINIEDIVSSYGVITEEIITIQEEIPFETITKDVSGSSEGTVTRVITEGQNGLREVTYKITYKDDVEISREEISSVVIKEPVDKIVQVNNKQTSRSNTRRAISSASVAELQSMVAGITPKIVTLNTSAYTASTCDKKPTDPGYGITASGAYVKEWYTVAAGKSYPLGTIIYIPYFKDKPNGGWFVVQDRGGAIKDNKLDVYMDTYDACIKFGRRNLECHIYVL